jgi:AcrR family transcriptional regulator
VIRPGEPPVPSDSTIDPRARRIARKSKRQDNRRHVQLACAREVLLAHCPVAFTMERLAAAAATSKAALYYYFRSREELVAALALEVLRREIATLSHVVVAADSGLAGLAALLRARVEHHLADRDGFRILYLWAPVLGDPRLLTEVHQLTAVVHTSLAARLQRDHKSGLLHPAVEPRRLPDLAWSLAQGLLIRIVSDPTLAWRELLNDACTALIRGAQDPSAIRHS